MAARFPDAAMMGHLWQNASKVALQGHATAGLWLPSFPLEFCSALASQQDLPAALSTSGEAQVYSAV